MDLNGSTAGIGLAIATSLAQEGATVVVNGRTEERIKTAIKQIKQTAANAKLEGVVADLATLAGASELFGQVTFILFSLRLLGSGFCTSSTMST